MVRPGWATGLGKLAAGRHRVSFALQGISLAPGSAAGLRYRYLLRGLADEWSRPSAAGEAQFVGLGPGRYVLEASVRRIAPGAAWSPVATSTFARPARSARRAGARHPPPDYLYCGFLLQTVRQQLGQLYLQTQERA